MPFYRRVADQNTQTRFVVLSPDPKNILDSYLSQHSLKPDAAYSIAGQSVRFRGTPTLVLVDSQGLIRDAWEGELDSEREAAVLRALK